MSSMAPVLAHRPAPSTQIALLGIAPRQTIRETVSARVERIRMALVSTSEYGFAVNLAATMGWRPERRSRELSGTDGLSVSTVYAEIALHQERGDQIAVDQITAALIGGLKTSSLQITPGSVIRVFEDHGQLTLRFDR